mgnify:CR=1 FL=1
MVTNARETPSFAVIDAIVHKCNGEHGDIISILREIQDVYGYVPPVAIERIAANTAVPAGEIFSIVTFYNFRLEPLGENLIRICRGAACELAEAERNSEAVSLEVGAKEGETSPDSKFTVERVTCLGWCGLSPCISINGEVFGRLTPERVREIVKQLKTEREAVPVPVKQELQEKT